MDLDINQTRVPVMATASRPSLAVAVRGATLPSAWSANLAATSAVSRRLCCASLCRIECGSNAGSVLTLGYEEYDAQSTQYVCFGLAPFVSTRRNVVVYSKFTQTALQCLQMQRYSCYRARSSRVMMRQMDLVHASQALHVGSHLADNAWLPLGSDISLIHSDLIRP